MIADLSDHPFSPENVRRESGAFDPSEAAWLRWVAKCERLFGHDIDGNDENRAGCGYSIDEAYTVWLAECSPEFYVAAVKSRARYAGGVQ